MLIHLIILGMVAYATAGLSMLIDAAMEKDMILHSYYLWLLKVCKVETDLQGNIIKANPLYYPLGGCIKCMNFWVGAVMFTFLAFIFGYTWELCFLYFWLFQGLSFHALKKHL